MSSYLLDPSALMQALPSLLPPASKVLASQQDGIAALIHTALAAVSFRLIAVDESSSPRSTLVNVLPIEWNAHGPSNHTFRYKHDQSSLEFVVKVAKLSSRTLINAIAIESDKAAALDICTNDFTSPSFFPQDVSAIDAPSLINGFISSNRVIDFMDQFKSQIIQKLIPGLHKEGYSETVTDEAAPFAGTSRQPPAPARPQPVVPPDAPVYDPLRVPFRPRNPFEIGRRDLDPIPRNPFAPPPLFSDDDDGMFVGPNHPIFSGRGPVRNDPSGVTGPWGGDGFLPPMGAPPGARFDPIGPRFGATPRGNRNIPGRGNVPGPDNDEFMPPGAGDMFM
ncbi:hypothetical protein FISHEDRAFT_75421 [Fistulina hepatica ATCC 64428]|uniref:Uncharacterized protein n=1 Tax=Fistulina hepatica ATCC 64428 TaxID=1128425 RepID=A0A0D7A895_9AGAR|nr:hypothetical protein FISHEDRAFT_75421 [Fistulina hepatica ATCC 64428]